MSTISINDFKREYLRNGRRIILFMTANSHEKEAVDKRIRPIDGTHNLTVMGATQEYKVGLFGKYLVARVHCKNQGSEKELASQVTCSTAIADFDPALIVMIGIAYGRDDRPSGEELYPNLPHQQIGDVLISYAIQPYSYLKPSEDTAGNTLVLDRNEKIQPGNIIRNQFSTFATNEDFPYHVYLGTILSGNWLVNNKTYKEWLIDTFEKDKKKKTIVGGEMEMAGVGAACRSVDQHEWIMVKAICDWAYSKEEHKEEYQIKAAENATDFCYRYFSGRYAENFRGVRVFKEKRDNTPATVNKYFMYYYRQFEVLSLASLAKKTSIPEGVLRQIEKGQPVDNMTVHLSKKIAKELKVSYTELLAPEDKAPSWMVEFYNENKKKPGMHPAQDTKLLFCDFDGTLTIDEPNQKHYSTWEKIWLALGYTTDDCFHLYRKFSQDEITHQKWCDLTQEYFKKKGFSEDTLEKVAQTMKLMPNVIETIKRLKKHGVKCYIISGSIDGIINRVLGEDNLYLFDGIACNHMDFDKKGELVHIEGTHYDFEGKAKYIEEKMRLAGVKPYECLFIGNSDNDEWAYKSNARTMVINPAKTSAAERMKWKYCLTDVRDFSTLLSYVLPLSYKSIVGRGKGQSQKRRGK